MKYVLQFVGYGWALIGFLGLCSSFKSMPGESEAQGLTLFLFMITFIFPGLICGGIGSAIGRKA